MHGGAHSTTLYADLDQLLAWYVSAKPGGAWVRFAVGGALDPAHAVVRQVREWNDAGSIERKDVVQGETRLFHLRRSSAPATPCAGQPRSLQLLGLLEVAAREGKPCPSYTALARSMGLRDRQVARHLFNRLREAGAVFVEGEGRGRKVRLTGSGAVLAACDLSSGSAAAPQPQGPDTS